MNASKDDRELDGFLAEAREGLEAHLHQVCPRGFQDVLDRAAEGRGPASGLPSASSRPTVVELDPSHRSIEAGDPELTAFVNDARKALDARVAARRRVPRRAWIATGVAVASIAALAVLVTGIGTYVKRQRPLGMDQAPIVVVPSPKTGHVQTHPLPYPSGRDKKQQATSTVIQEPSRDEPEYSSDSSATARDRRRRSARPKNLDQTAKHLPPPEPTIENRIADLDRRAQAQWRRGDRAEAEATYRALIELAGQSQYAELAYADLFSLIRQTERREVLHATWRDYLARFPHGRFADDARAGLCRATVSSDVGACWERYLTDFPRGSYTNEAEQRVAEMGESP